MTAADWRTLAVCVKVGEPADWFPDGRERSIEAVQACAHCPVRLDCLGTAFAFESGAPAEYRTGVWGGLTPRQRAKLDGKRRAKGNQLDRAACPWPGTTRALGRHAALNTPACPPCRGLELEQQRIAERDERVLRLCASGRSVGQVALAVGERRDTVRGILDRHNDKETV